MPNETAASQTDPSAQPDTWRAAFPCGEGGTSAEAKFTRLSISCIGDRVYVSAASEVIDQLGCVNSRLVFPRSDIQ